MKKGVESYQVIDRIFLKLLMMIYYLPSL